jgi:hypothetical protein
MKGLIVQYFQERYASSQKENIGKIYMKNVIREKASGFLQQLYYTYIQYSGQWDEIMKVSLLTRENIWGGPC